MFCDLSALMRLAKVWHDFHRTAAQCIVLAGLRTLEPLGIMLTPSGESPSNCPDHWEMEGPGVLIGTALMYVVAKFVFPYGFLAATDQNEPEPFSSCAESFHALEQLSSQTASVASLASTRGWGDFECAAFGSVLAATDPVAVVGLLKARCDFSGCRDWRTGFLTHLTLGKSD